LLDVSRQEKERCTIRHEYELEAQIKVLKDFDMNGPFPRAILTYLDESKQRLKEFCAASQKRPFNLYGFTDIIYGNREESIESVAKAIRLTVAAFERTDLRDNLQQPYVRRLQNIDKLCPPKRSSDESRLTTLDGIIRESRKDGPNIVKYLNDCREKMAEAVTANVRS
jgi:hypothetical protein